jgi:nitrite reductase (NO-forming)
MKGAYVAAGIIAIIVIGGAVYFATRPSEEEVTPTPTEIESFTVVGTEYSFSPDSIAVEEGHTVRITFRNEGAVSHNWGISELGIRTGTIGPGASDTVEFTVTQTGIFTFDCSVPGHKEQGMTGQLTVEEHAH